MEFRILEGLPPEDVRRFLALARRRTFERDEIVFHHGDPADAVHLITKGRFARRVLSPVGQSAMLAVRGPGETFGELALVWTGMSRLVTVSALEPGETLSVAGATFRGLLGRHPELKDVLIRLLAERLLYSDKRIVAAHFLDADARVRWTLLQLVPIYGGDDGDTKVVIPLTQESLAELAGTARGTVNRVLREEQGRGAVRLERGLVRVLEPDALRARVRGLPRV
jgi:CRP/FNR family transcriptional regulator, cyclic AMP receptor protein